MDIRSLIKLPLKEFKNIFEFQHDTDEFTKKHNGLNILQWALFTNNIDIATYLCDKHSYDLKKELSIPYWVEEDNKSDYVRLCDILPFTYIINNITFENYKKTLNFLKSNNISLNLLSFNEIVSFLNDEGYTKLFNKEFFEYALNEGYIKDEILNTLLLPLVAINNMSDTIPKGIASSIILKKGFIPLVSKISDFVNIIENLNQLTQLNQEEVLKFKSDVISSFIKTNNIQSLDDLEIMVVEFKLSQLKMTPKTTYLDSDFYKKNDITTNTNKIGTGLILSLLLKEINPNRKDILPLNDKILQIIDEMNDISVLINLENQDHNIVEFINKKTEEILLQPRLSYNFEKINILTNEDSALNRWTYPNENYFNIFFTRGILNDNENIFKKIEHNHTNALNKFRHDFLYYYLATLEENKILNLSYKKDYSKPSNFKECFDFITDMVEKNLNLIIDEQVLTSTINNINGYSNYYRVNVIQCESDFNQNKYGLLKTIFNSKMTLSEINENLSRIKGNENINIKNIIRNIINNGNIDYSFLINEANTIEKLDLLLDNGVKYPKNIDGSKFLHNIALNKDPEFINTIWLRKPEINEESLYTFLRNINCYAGSIYNKFSICHALTVNEIYKDLFNFIHKKCPELMNKESIIKMMLDYSNSTILGSKQKRDILFAKNRLIDEKLLNAEFFNVNSFLAQIEKTIINKELLKNETSIKIKRRI